MYKLTVAPEDFAIASLTHITVDEFGLNNSSNGTLMENELRREIAISLIYDQNDFGYFMNMINDSINGSNKRHIFIYLIESIIMLRFFLFFSILKLTNSIS